MNANDIIERLCILQSEVAGHLEHIERTDCFCGKSGFWGRIQGYDGTVEHGYRNDGKALEFIEAAVKEKIEKIEREIQAHDEKSLLCKPLLKCCEKAAPGETTCKDGRETFD